ncbi:MAG TPA: efflux RND transporter periplasmic adaptor subunit [Polyangiaceae bacterium]|nr:efflux RND transporter periplasmic adaptor subunit [Polyangiaceae bacterium]
MKTAEVTNHTVILSAMVLLAVAPSCQSSEAATGATDSKAPPGQVWLTPAQVAQSKIEVTTVGEQVVEDSIVTSGTISLDDLRSGHVFSPVTGRVVKIIAQLGQHVKKGDPLATIESPDIGQAVSDTHKAEADLIAAEHDLRRKRELFAQKAAAAADVEASEDTERNAKAELERARQKQFLLRVGNVDAVSQTYTFPAPIDGEVLLRNINPGVEVQGQYSGGAGNNCIPGLTTNAVCGELFTIGELDKVWMLGDVYEIDLPRVHVGATARVTTIAHPGQVFTGTVDWISGALDPNTRTAKVRCTFDNPDGILRPMMYATAAITADQRKSVAIPRSAVVRLGDYKVVFVQIGEAGGQVRFERLPVLLDESLAGLYVGVKHGVDAGQKVVSNGADVLAQQM